MSTTQVDSTIHQVSEKKRVIKKKVLRVKQDKVDNKVSETISVETSNVTDAEDDDNSCIIPSSRIKNYINKEKLNKDLDSIIDTIKNADSKLDLNSLISKSVQKKIGSVIKDKEKFNSENPDAKVEINLNTIAVDVLSKQRFKFSNNSFKVLSVFSDMIIEEITKHAMDELVKNKKSIINNKYVFTNSIENGSLYNVYSKFPSFIAMKQEAMQDTSDNVDSTETTETTEKVAKGINFEFYIRKICNKLKGSNDAYSKIKVSEKYQKFCSNIILDFLDQVAPQSKIVLEVMTTKTITDLVFHTIIKLQLWGSTNYDSIISELHKRLTTSTKAVA